VTDLDFDEIDKAINSAKATDKPTEIGNIANQVQPELNAAEPVPKPQPTLAGRRSSGQFMDVVHPSSNMRKSTLTMPERPPVKKPDMPADEAPIDSIPPIEKPIEPISVESDNKLPDPIEIGEPKKVTVEKADNEKAEFDEEDDIDKITQEITDELNQKSPDSLPESPFITGTKVEKRPLGAFSDENTQADEESELKQDEKEDKPTQEDEKTADIIPSTNDPLSEELEDKLIKIESDDVSEAIELPNETAEEQPKSSPPQPKPSVSESPHPIEATSINQQYKEHPSTGDQNSGAIYDTEAYHKALMHPPKKKSGWMWVVWIILILVVGAGAGVFVFYQVLPLL